jgi:hypothetical protein
MGRSRRSQYNPSRKRRAARPLERVEVPEQDQPEQEELGVREQTGNCKWSSAERFSMFAMLAWTYDYSEVARAEAALYDGDVGDMVERHTSGYAQRMMRAGGDSSAVRMRIEDRMTESNSYQHTKKACCLLCYPIFLHNLFPITSLPHTGDRGYFSGNHRLPLAACHLAIAISK